MKKAVAEKAEKYVKENTIEKTAEIWFSQRRQKEVR